MPLLGSTNWISRKILNYKKFSKIIALLIGIFLLLFGFQMVYFTRIYTHADFRPQQDFDLVLSWNAEGAQPVLDMALSYHKPLFLSLAPWDQNPFAQRSAADLAQVYIDTKATTTVQNASIASAFIRKGGYKKVLLDVDWFHLPRSLFLTRLYLLGGGVEVIPCMKTPLPNRWWSNRDFHVELYKFWGSLGRVGLALVGFETGPSVPSR